MKAIYKVYTKSKNASRLRLAFFRTKGLENPVQASEGKKYAGGMYAKDHRMLDLLIISSDTVE